MSDSSGRTAIYLRKSTKDHADESIDGQRETVHTWMRSRGENPSDAMEYVDVLSAFDEDRGVLSQRPGWSDLEHEIRAGRITRLVVRHVDRLYRRLDDLGSLVKLVEKHNLEIATVWSGDIDLSSPAGRAVARILASIAMGEVETMHQRVNAKLAANRAAGKPHGGNRAFGYNRDGSLHPIEADYVKKALDAVIDGVGLNAIEKQWREAGVTGTSGAQIHRTTIRRILTSERLIGHTIYKGQDIGDFGRFAPITTPEKLAAVQNMLNDPRRRTNVNSPQIGNAPAYLLTKITECSVCAGTVASTATKAKVGKDGEKKTYPMYRCPNRCVGINRQTADEFASLAMARVWMRGDIAELAPTEDLRARLVEAASRREELHHERETYKKMRQNGTLSLNDFEEMMESTSATETAIEADYDRISQRFTLATTLASPVSGSDVNISSLVDLVTAFDGQELNKRRQQVREAWKIVLRPTGVASPRTFVVGGQEYREQVSKKRIQERRMLFVSNLSDALSFDPVEEDLAEAMAAVAESTL